jgi:hypothetical protein
MKIPHELIKDGMVVWAGKDPRKGYCYFTYHTDRLHYRKRAVCFPDMVETLEKLGFEITPHWTVEGQLRGYYGAVGLQLHGPLSSLDGIEVSPVVQMILNNGINNRNLKNLLFMEDELN